MDKIALVFIKISAIPLLAVFIPHSQSLSRKSLIGHERQQSQHDPFTNLRTGL